MIRDFYNKNKLFAGIVLLCILLRLAFFISVRPWNNEVEHKLLEKDALEYNVLAVNILNYHQFSYTENGPPNSFRTPGYPFYLAAVYFIFGQAPWVVLLTQIFIDTFSCIILYFLFLRIFNIKIALIASLFYALDPFLILHTSTLLSDILFVFLLILASSLLSQQLRSCHSFDTFRNRSIRRPNCSLRYERNRFR